MVSFGLLWLVASVLHQNKACSTAPIRLVLQRKAFRHQPLASGLIRLPLMCLNTITRPPTTRITLDYDYLYKFFRAYVLAGRNIANDPITPPGKTVTNTKLPASNYTGSKAVTIWGV